jgi:hypothetical protein
MLPGSSFGAGAFGAGMSRLALSVGGGGKEKEKEAVRQCFLFSHHLIITTR